MIGPSLFPTPAGNSSFIVTAPIAGVNIVTTAANVNGLLLTSGAVFNGAGGQNVQLFMWDGAVDVGRLLGGVLGGAVDTFILPFPVLIRPGIGLRAASSDGLGSAQGSYRLL